MKTGRASHTPGPWRISANRRWGNYWIKAGTDIREIAFAVVKPGPNAEANARLIATTPEMKDELTALADAAEKVVIFAMRANAPLLSEYIVLRQQILSSRAAIAKAEGEVV